MACKKCFPYQLPECPEGFLIDSSSIEDGEEYLVSIRDKFGAVTTQTVTAGENVLSVDTSGFPEAYFNRYAGTFSIEVKDTNCNPVVLMFDGQEYDCISLSFFGSEAEAPEEATCITTIK